MIYRDQYQIRAQFLQSLGIVRAAPTSSSSETANTTATSSNQEESTVATTAKQQQQPQHHVEALKYNREDDIHTDTDDDDDDDSQQSRVSFRDTVVIVEIPSYRDYPDAIRQDLWNGVKAVAEIVQRNTVEYQAEGWDWHKVLEEDAFVTLPTGELLHPATYKKQQDEKAMRKRQLEQQKRKKKGYAYKSVAACLNFSTPAHQQPKAKSHSSRSRRRKSTSSSRRCGKANPKVGSRIIARVASQ